MTSLVLILLSGLFDRMRGGGWFSFSHAAGAVLMGSVIAHLLGFHDFTLAAFVAAFWIGAAPGWGNPLFAAFEFRPMRPTDYEWWQRGILRTSVPAALIFRGLMWTVPVLILAPLNLGLLIFVPLGALAFPVAVYIARDIPGSRSNAWVAMEFGRGLLMGLAAYLGGLYA